MEFSEAKDRLEAFTKLHGHARVPRSHIDPDGFRLGIWVHNTRSKYRTQQLSADQIAVLEALGFEWRPIDRAVSNQKLAEALAEYRRVHHRPPPADYITPDGLAVGAWLQAMKHRARRDSPSASGTAKRLDQLEVPLWERNHDDLWARGIESLAWFKNTYGDTRVPLRWRDDSGFPLGRWVNSRRADAAAGRLKPHRRKELDELDFEYVLGRSGHSEIR
jgi:hypothetical protein